MYKSTKTRGVSLRSNSKQENKEEKVSSTTPIATRRSLTEDECLSPVQIRCTQDGGDDELDVIWDWNSPQSRIKKTFNKPRKRPLNTRSPQIPRKLPPKSNLIPKFTSLKAELEKLSHDEFNNDEDNLVINLSDEEDFVDKNNGIKEATNIITEKLELSDLFGDDSFDEEMVKCSQKIEEQFAKPSNPLLNCFTMDIADDSFDALIEDFTEEDIVRLSQEEPTQKLQCVTPVKNPRTIYRTLSTPVRSDRFEFNLKNNSSTPIRGTSCLPRTKSAEDCKKLASPESVVVTCSPDEIEKKRLEAKAKLELRKTQKEIEKKRLEALERLKRNRLQRETASKSK